MLANVYTSGYTVVIHPADQGLLERWAQDYLPRALMPITIQHSQIMPQGIAVLSWRYQAVAVINLEANTIYTSLRPTQNARIQDAGATCDSPKKD